MRCSVHKASLALALVLGLVLVLAVFVLGGQAASLPGLPLRPANPVPHPVGNTHTAPPTTTVSITYDEPIDPTTVSTQTFAVHAMQTGLHLQAYSVNGGTISLTPSEPFHPGELVQVSATTGTLSAVDALGPVRPTVWQFRVAVRGGSGVYAEDDRGLGDSGGSGAMAIGDLDADGDLDAFFARGNDQANEVWLNDGTGAFASNGQSLGDATSTGVALGDVDGDGDLDAFVGNLSGSAKVWLNDGSASFTDSGQSLGEPEVNSAADVALADLDGDGDLDAFAARENPNRVWLNDGMGTFSDSGQNLGASFSFGLDLGDLDGDGDVDAFVANADAGAGEGQPNRVWLNDGQGTFTDSGQSLGMSDSFAVALGDVDGDGDLDAFVANNNFGYSGTNRLWLNDGAGVFHDSGQNPGDLDGEAAALGDLDGDGDLDAFLGNDGVLLNNGLGILSDSGQRLGSYFVSADVALGDIDGDGDLDAFTGNHGANKAWKNVTRLYLPLMMAER